MTITMPIDKRTAAVLKAKGFSISDDGKVAKIQGEMTLDIVRLPIDPAKLVQWRQYGGVGR